MNNQIEEHSLESRVTVIESEMGNIKEKVKDHEALIEKNTEVINELITSNAETKVYIKQIFDKIGQLDNKIFEYMRSLSSANTALAKQKDKETEENSRNIDKWLQFAKWIISGTIVLALGYIFGNGKVF